MKFRKRPVVIEAVQWTGENEQEVYSLGGTRELCIAKNEDDFPGMLSINTLEGIMRANINDWIIKGVSGELYPCKPDIFEKTYERVLEG